MARPGDRRTSASATSLIASGLHRRRYASRGITRAKQSPSSTCEAALSWKCQPLQSLRLKLPRRNSRPSMMRNARCSNTIQKRFIGLTGITNKATSMARARWTLRARVRALYAAQAMSRLIKSYRTIILWIYQKLRYIEKAERSTRSMAGGCVMEWMQHKGGTRSAQSRSAKRCIVYYNPSSRVNSEPSFVSAILS